MRSESAPPPPESGRPKPALEWYGKGVAMAGYGLLCLQVIGLSVLALTDPEAYRLSVARESGWVERFTAVWYACGGLLLFVVAAKERGILARSVYILGGLTLVFFAGEEADWSLEFFNSYASNLMQKIGYDGGFNIHNIQRVENSLLTHYF